MELGVPTPTNDVRTKRSALGLGLALALGLVVFVAWGPRTSAPQAGALVASSAVSPSLRARAGTPAMMAGAVDPNSFQSKGTKAKAAPSGPFGGSKKPGDPSSWFGDQSRSAQIKKFEQGDDYLFFQGPAPKTAVQEDLPNFFSPENFQNMEVTGTQIAVTGVGLAAAGALAAGLAAPDLVEKLR